MLQLKMASPVGIERPNCLSLNTPKSKSRVTFKEENCITSYCKPTSISSRKYQSESEKCKRKRTQSCSLSFEQYNKKRRTARTIVLPTKFLLGGNITDPLNLEALDKGDIEESSEFNVGTEFRRGTTVQVIIPPNINDPLNLDACSDEGNEQLADAISRQRRRRKSRKRKRRNSEPVSLTREKVDDCRLSTSLEEPAYNYCRKSPTLPEAFSSEEESAVIPGASLLPKQDTAELKNIAVSDILKKDFSSAPVTKTEEKLSTNVEIAQTLLSPTRPPPTKKQRTKSEDKIVSPVIPQPGVDRKRYARQHSSDKSSTSSVTSTNSISRPASECQSKNICFQYGNYNQYYGYRNLNNKPDFRLKVMEQDWFTGKQVLDIGCNIGHVTLTIGKEFCPQRIVGIDIDKKLVNIAQKNVKHYLKNSPDRETVAFPDSMQVLYGPLKSPVTKKGNKKFPYNVKFYQTNYVLENDALLETVRPEFDVILCLSVTKWIHLNYGDVGLVRFFKRILRNLHSGGMLILEPQAWASYKKKKKLTPEIHENFKNIRIFPNKFGDLLHQIGFQFCSKRSVVHFSKGFDRPIYIYRKTCDPTDKDTASSSTSSADHVVSLSTNDVKTLPEKTASTGSTNQFVPPPSNMSAGRPTILIPSMECAGSSSKRVPSEAERFSSSSQKDTNESELISPDQLVNITSNSLSSIQSEFKPDVR